jgi:serine/threonine protein kinase
MKELKHPHIVGFKESFVENDEFIIILEFCESTPKHKDSGRSGPAHQEAP